MTTSYIFADEAGCFTFKNKQGASAFFILCTVAAPKWTIANDLLHVRRELAVNGEDERDKLHATSDLQEVRNEVFKIIDQQDFRIDATILRKNRAFPRIRETNAMFYQYAWYYHFKHVGPNLSKEYDKMLITAAALGEKKTKASFKSAVNNTVQQILPRDRWEVSFHESSKDPILWVADYCAWAIQRFWEKGDDRSYKLIAKKIATEFDLFKNGRDNFY